VPTRTPSYLSQESSAEAGAIFSSISLLFDIMSVHRIRLLVHCSEPPVSVPQSLHNFLDRVTPLPRPYCRCLDVAIVNKQNDRSQSWDSPVDAVLPFAPTYRCRIPFESKEVTTVCCNPASLMAFHNIFLFSRFTRIGGENSVDLGIFLFYPRFILRVMDPATRAVEWINHRCCSCRFWRRILLPPRIVDDE
jgi:hypothetical protein